MFDQGYRRKVLSLSLPHPRLLPGRGMPTTPTLSTGIPATTTQTSKACRTRRLRDVSLSLNVSLRLRLCLRLGGLHWHHRRRFVLGDASMRGYLFASSSLECAAQLISKLLTVKKKVQCDKGDRRHVLPCRQWVLVKPLVL
jgi:hypothetical protein